MASNNEKERVVQEQLRLEASYHELARAHTRLQDDQAKMAVAHAALWEDYERLRLAHDHLVGEVNKRSTTTSTSAPTSPPMSTSTRPEKARPAIEESKKSTPASPKNSG